MAKEIKITAKDWCDLKNRIDRLEAGEKEVVRNTINTHNIFDCLVCKHKSLYYVYNSFPDYTTTYVCVSCGSAYHGDVQRVYKLITDTSCK